MIVIATCVAVNKRYRCVGYVCAYTTLVANLLATFVVFAKNQECGRP